MFCHAADTQVNPERFKAQPRGSSTWAKLVGPFTSDLMNNSSLLKPIIQIRNFPNIYANVDIYLDALKKLWVYCMLYRESYEYSRKVSYIQKQKGTTKYTVNMLWRQSVVFYTTVQHKNKKCQP